MTKAGGLPRRPKGRAGAKRPIEGASARTTRKGYKARRWVR